jgi:hypothetical protein
MCHLNLHPAFILIAGEQLVKPVAKTKLWPQAIHAVTADTTLNPKIKMDKALVLCPH